MIVRPEPSDGLAPSANVKVRGLAAVFSLGANGTVYSVIRSGMRPYMRRRAAMQRATTSEVRGCVAVDTDREERGRGPSEFSKGAQFMQHNSQT